MLPIKIVLLCACLLVTVSSYGQTPTPVVPTDKPNQHNSSPHENPATDTRGTEETPLIIKVLPPANNEEPTNNSSKNKKSESADWWWDKSPEILLALATIGLWIVTWQLVKGAQDTAKRQLRAYVWLDTFIKPYPSVNPDCYAVSLIVTNGGKTWARNLTIQKDMIQQELGDESDPFDLMEQPIGLPMVLGPGQTHELQFGVVERPDVQKLAKGEIRRAYVAVARYQDTLSPAIIRQTQLSRRLNGDMQGGVSFGWLPTHNCADEDCP